MTTRWAVATFVLAACAAAPDAPLRLQQPVVLLGEVHDNAAQHALRLQAFKDLLATGARPALAMEQLDRDRQAALALEVEPDADPAAFVSPGGADPGCVGWLCDMALARRLWPDREGPQGAHRAAPMHRIQRRRTGARRRR